MICVAVIVVALVVPRTRTGTPAVTALAVVEVVPFWYVVADASLTVTFWPADVVMVNPDVDMPSTVPDAPPAAGPDRALDPPPDAGPDGLPEAAADGLLTAAAAALLELECSMA
jgi:hypothetical protein